MIKITKEHDTINNSIIHKGKCIKHKPANCISFLPGIFFLETYFGFDKKPKFSRRNPVCSGTKKENEVM